MIFTILLEWDEVTVYEHTSSGEVQKFLINGEESLRYTQIDHSNKMIRLGKYLSERLQHSDLTDFKFTVIHHNINLKVLKALSEALLPCTRWSVYHLEDVLPLILIRLNKLKVGESLTVCFRNDTIQVSIDKQGIFDVQPVKNVVGYAIEMDVIPALCFFDVKSLAEQYSALHIQSSEQINKFQTRLNEQKQKYELLQREYQLLRQDYDSLLHSKNSCSEENLKNFYEVGECFVKVAAATSAANGLNPIPGVDVVADLGIMTKLFSEIRDIFAIDEEQLRLVSEKIIEFNEVVARITDLKTTDNLKNIIIESGVKGAKYFAMNGAKQIAINGAKQISKLGLVGIPFAVTAGYSLAYNIGIRYLRDCYTAACVIAEYEQYGEEAAKSKLEKMMKDINDEVTEEEQDQGFLKKGFKKLFK